MDITAGAMVIADRVSSVGIVELKIWITHITKDVSNGEHVLQEVFVDHIGDTTRWLCIHADDFACVVHDLKPEAALYGRV